MHDADYRARYASRELVRQREAARSRGIGPYDADYPDLWDVVRRLPPSPEEEHRERTMQRLLGTASSTEIREKLEGIRAFDDPNGT
ncbi:MAG TPA: hypothetical protein VFL98_01325 [Candidatus Paceibacterota bacterium]|nr:hypothetical protein [Candidatus Paceibacterota bacterium]